MKRSRYTLLKGWHKWICLVITILVLGFAGSGIILNHRDLVSGIDLPRSWLPKAYHYKSWSGGSLTGKIRATPDEEWIYGAVGVWAYDPQLKSYDSRSDGLDSGADRRSVQRVVRTNRGDLYALTAYNLYKWQADKKEWAKQPKLTPKNERLADLETQGDTLVLLSRSHLYLIFPSQESPTLADLPAPDDYEPRVSLFSTIWQIHSGAFFGTIGRLVVDLMGVALILLSITGVLITFVPKKAKVWKQFLKEHNRWGKWCFWVLLFVTITGAFLRPPLMITVIKAEVPTIPGTNLYSTNPWNNKLRMIRRDPITKEWLLSTSQGFYALKQFGKAPKRLTDTPPVSVMGLNVWEWSDRDSLWVVGSFSGAFKWSRQEGQVYDALTGKAYTESGRKGMPIFGTPISGYTIDSDGRERFYSYSTGELQAEDAADTMPPMPTEISPGRISLWHAALELHVGRLYGKILGPLQPLYIFLSALLLTLALVTGWMLYRRYYRRRGGKKPKK